MRTKLFLILIILGINFQSFSQRYKNEFEEKVEYFTGKNNGKDVTVSVKIMHNVSVGKPFLEIDVKLINEGNSVKYEGKEFFVKDLGSEEFYNIKPKTFNITYDIYKGENKISTEKKTVNNNEKYTEDLIWGKFWRVYNEKRVKEIWRTGYEVKNLRLMKIDFDLKSNFEKSEEPLLEVTEIKDIEVLVKNKKEEITPLKTKEVIVKEIDRIDELNIEEQRIKQIEAKNRIKLERLKKEKKTILVNKLKEKKKNQIIRKKKSNEIRNQLEIALEEHDLKETILLKKENAEINKIENSIFLLNDNGEIDIEPIIETKEDIKQSSSVDNSIKYNELIKKGDVFAENKFYEKSISFYKKALKYTKDSTEVDAKIAAVNLLIQKK